MERQYLSSSKRATKVQQSLNNVTTKPQLPKRSPSMLSPYRTPIAAASFYGTASETPTKKHKATPPLREKGLYDTIGDDSHDEIDFLSQPKSLHERMRPKTSVTTKQPEPYQTKALSMNITAILVNEAYCCLEKDIELVSFPSHVLLLCQGKERTKLTWREVRGCKLAERNQVIVALDVIPESATGRLFSSLCAAPLHQVHLFLFLENNESWPICQQRLRTAVQALDMTEEEASSLVQSIDSAECRSWSFAQHPSDQRTGPMKKPTPIVVGERHRLLQEQARKPAIDTPEDETFFTDTLGPRTRSRTHSEYKSTSSAGNAPILRYPSTGPFAVTLLQADLNRLQENEYLNDTLIEFGLRFCQEQIKSRDPHLAQQIYVFNTFFYQKLTEYRDRSKSYEHVRKWTNRVNMYVYPYSSRFEKKYIVVPIHENMHWYLAIVVNPHMILKKRDPLRSLSSGFRRRRSTRRSTDEAVVQIHSDSDSTQDPIALVEGDSKKTKASSTNSDMGESESTFVFVLDSLGAHHGPVKTALRDYLRLEARAKGFVPSDVDLKTLGNPIHVDVRVPEQPNYCDCGIYLLHFFDRFFSDPDHFFHIILAAQRASNSASEMHEAWQQEAIEQKRGWWRDLIWQLSAEWTQQHKDDESCIVPNM